MSAETVRRPQLVRQTPPRPLAERGRILYAEDIQAMYGKHPDGRWRKGLRWIWREFAPLTHSRGWISSGR